MMRDRDPFEQRARRVIHALGRHGRRLQADGGCWAVFASNDRRRRPVVRIDRTTLARMLAAGTLQADGDTGYRLGVDHRLGGDPALPCSPSPLAPHPPFAQRKGRGREGFAGLVEKAGQGHGPLTYGQARAGLRFQADTELTACGSVASARWDMMRTGTSRGGSGIPPGMEAMARLRALSAALNAAEIAVIRCACISAMSLASLEKHLSLPARSSGRALSAALEKTRSVYDSALPGRGMAEIGLPARSEYL